MPDPFVVDGHRIDYEVRGEGRPLVLLHGLTLDRRVLIEACEPVLARPGLRRIYVDLPGHGRSVGNRERASADDLVSALAALVGAVAADRPLLVGYSYGGYLAQGLVRELAVDGLFLVCPVVEADPGKRARPPRRVVRRDEGLAFADAHERETFEEVAALQTHALLAAYHRCVYPASVAVDRAFVDAERARYAMARPYHDALAGFGGPVSIVCGRDDHWVGFEDALRLARTFARSSFHMLPECGHLLPLEAPAQFHALLDGWLARALAL